MPDTGSGASPNPTAAPPGSFPYNDLSPAEQAVADRGRDTTGWDEITDSYAAAGREIAQRAAAQAAADQLGAEDVVQQGVVP